MHLTRLAAWPTPSQIDRALSDETRLVMRIASLGRAARAKAQIKVRQPVAELFVKLPTSAEEQALERLAPQLLEELNVKELRIVRDESDFLRFEVKPNLKLLGQKYGRDVQDDREARWRRCPTPTCREIARAVGAGETVEVAGKTLDAGRAARERPREGGLRVGGGERRGRHRLDGADAGAGARGPRARDRAPHPEPAQGRRLRDRRPHPDVLRRATTTIARRDARVRRLRPAGDAVGGGGAKAPRPRTRTWRRRMSTGTR